MSGPGRDAQFETYQIVYTSRLLRCPTRILHEGLFEGLFNIVLC